MRGKNRFKTDSPFQVLINFLYINFFGFFTCRTQGLITFMIWYSQFNLNAEKTVLKSGRDQWAIGFPKIFSFLSKSYLFA